MSCLMGWLTNYQILNRQDREGRIAKFAKKTMQLTDSGTQITLIFADTKKFAPSVKSAYKSKKTGKEN